MKATLFSILLALILGFIPVQNGLSASFGWILIAFSIALLLSLPLIYAAAWTPLQKGEQNITPRLIERASRDKQLLMASFALLIFSLISIAIYYLLLNAPDLNPSYLFLGWLILFGVALDLMGLLINRIMSYLNPFKAAEIFTRNAKENCRLGNLDLVVDSIEALSEVSLRAIERSNTSLAAQGVLELREVGDTFFNSAKSFAALSEELKSLEKTRVDKVSYILFYLLGRFEMIHQKAAQKKFEPLATQVLSSLGKLALSSAKFDLTLVMHPILTLGRTARLGEQLGLKDSGVKGEIVLLEVAKSLVRECDLTYVEIKSPFFTLIDNLDKIAKDLFKEDKEVSISTLTQPFLQLKEIMDDPKIATHQDTPSIKLEIDRVLSEYSALQAVMLAMPKIPTAVS